MNMETQEPKLSPKEIAEKNKALNKLLSKAMEIDFPDVEKNGTVLENPFGRGDSIFWETWKQAYGQARNLYVRTVVYPAEQKAYEEKFSKERKIRMALIKAENDNSSNTIANQSALAETISELLKEHELSDVMAGLFILCGKQTILN